MSDTATEKRSNKYLSNLLNRSKYTQIQIAKMAGFKRPNFLSMMKDGTSKIPVSRVPALSRALNTDPKIFLRLVMEDYFPEEWKVIESTLGHIMTDNEVEIIDYIRKKSDEIGISDPKILPEHQEILDELIERSAKK